MKSLTVKKILFALLWVGFVTYAFGFAPPSQPDTPELIQNLIAGNWKEINPIVVALFNLMGIWPIAYSSLLFFDGRGQKIGAWPFAIASFGVGAFAILPYLVLRQPQPEFNGEKSKLLQVLDSRILGVILLLGAIALLVFGITQGNWQDFIYQWQTRRFIHVMSLDFCLLALLFPALLGDDMARRGLDSSIAFWAVSLVPLFGPLAYLCTRPPLEAKDSVDNTSMTKLTYNVKDTTSEL